MHLSLLKSCLDVSQNSIFYCSRVVTTEWLPIEIPSKQIWNDSKINIIPKPICLLRKQRLQKIDTRENCQRNITQCLMFVSGEAGIVNYMLIQNNFSCTGNEHRELGFRKLKLIWAFSYRNYIYRRPSDLKNGRRKMVGSKTSDNLSQCFLLKKWYW